VACRLLFAGVLLVVVGLLVVLLVIVGLLVVLLVIVGLLVVLLVVVGLLVQLLVVVGLLVELLVIISGLLVELLVVVGLLVELLVIVRVIVDRSADQRCLVCGIFGDGRRTFRVLDFFVNALDDCRFFCCCRLFAVVVVLIGGSVYLVGGVRGLEDIDRRAWPCCCCNRNRLGIQLRGRQVCDIFQQR
jgi:hypothetical protein